jgi:uncharacterized protein
MKSRFLKNKIIKTNKSAIGRIIVLTGARQTGKTTLAKNCFPEYKYLSIEDPILRIQYKELTADQWKAFYPLAILDEVQKEPVLVESIKSVYDQYEESKYLLLGSSQLLLLQKIKESLAGRCVIQEVFPLTLPEILTKNWNDVPKKSFFQNFLIEKKIPQLLPSFKLYQDYSKRDETLNYYLKNGGYPALISTSLTDIERSEWLKNYVRTYLERDVRDLADFKSLDPFIKIQRITSLLTGQLVNYTQLSKEAGVSANTAQKFLQYLEISYQTIMLQPWHSNKLKRLVKTPKLHYLDPGVQKAIVQKTGDLTGHEFESAIIAEIYKQAQTIDFMGSFYHLRTYDGTEVDLVLETEKGFITVEVKMTNNVTKSDVRHLSSLKDILTKPVLQSFIISNDKTIKSFPENILALPAAMFLT